MTTKNAQQEVGTVREERVNYGIFLAARHIGHAYPTLHKDDPHHHFYLHIPDSYYISHMHLSDHSCSYKDPTFLHDSNVCTVPLEEKKVLKVTLMLVQVKDLLLKRNPEDDVRTSKNSQKSSSVTEHCRVWYVWHDIWCFYCQNKYEICLASQNWCTK